MSVLPQDNSDLLSQLSTKLGVGENKPRGIWGLFSPLHKEWNELGRLAKNTAQCTELKFVSVHKKMYLDCELLCTCAKQ